jgi:hypothetical protein
MNIQNKYNIGQIVYLTTDPQQYKRIISAIVIHEYGLIYELSVGEETTYHEAFEISLEKDIIMAQEND